MIQVVKILFLLLITFTSAYCQEYSPDIKKRLTKFDSIIHAKIDADKKVSYSCSLMGGIWNRTKNYFLLDSLANISLDIVAKYNIDTCNASNLFYYKSIALAYSSNFDESITMSNRLLACGDLTTNQEKATVLYALAEAYMQSGNDSMAIESYYRITRMDGVDERLSLYAQINRCRMYMAAGETDIALSYLLEANEKEKDPSFANMIMHLYLMNKKIDSGVIFGNSYFSNTPYDIRNIKPFFTYCNLKILQNKNFESVKGDLLNYSNKYSDNKIFKRYKLEFTETMGLLCFKIENYTKSSSYYKQAYKEAKLINNIPFQGILQYKILRSLAYSYSDSLGFKLETYNENQVKKDSVNRYKAIKELETKYETEKKEQEIVLLGKDKEILALQNKRKLWLIGFLIIGLTSLGAFLFYFRRRQLLKQQLLKTIVKNKELEKQRSEDRVEQQKQQLDQFIGELVEKNQLITSLKQEKVITEETLNSFNDILFSKATYDSKWSKITIVFDSLYPNFTRQLREQTKSEESLSSNEIRLAMLLKLNLTTKEMSEILFVSEAAVSKARQRLSKKMKKDIDLAELVTSLT